MSTPTLFQLPIRIYWEDTDASGVVYHANYARFFERARSEWLRQHRIDQNQLAQTLGTLIVVRRMAFELERPARLDDLCLASVESVQARKASAIMQQVLRRQPEQTVLVSAQITLACLHATTFRPTPLPAAITAILSAIAMPPAISP